jgi:tRNA (guanine37-N1)-methyltransferase
VTTLKIDVLTLFPQMFRGPLSESLIGKAQDKGLVQIRVHDLRDYSTDPKHRKVDDKQFGGGAGMLLKVEPIYNALKALCGDLENPETKPHVVYLSPQGKVLDNNSALRLSGKKHLVLLCGHYEGIDERAFRWIDEEVSIGNYVLTGGELPAMVLTDAVCRMVPGVVKEWESVRNDSFFGRSLLDHAQYTRPAEFMGMKVPETLVSGNHGAIEEWRRKSSLDNTLRKRPELIDGSEERKAS